MARILQPHDAHVIIQELVNQATGKNLAVVDTSTFVSAGETALASGMENVLNALSLIIGRTLVASRPYSGKLNILNAINTGVYTHRLRKISFYGRETEAAGNFNTVDNAGAAYKTNLANGYDNGINGGVSTESMWMQNQPIPLELNFAGSNVWQDSSTIYVDQLKAAFRDEASFNSFLAGVLTERENDIESQKEANRRMTLLNFIAGAADIGYSVNMVTAFNTRFGTSYTAAQLLSTYYKQFYEFFVATVRRYSDLLTDRTSIYHWNPTRSDGLKLLRHTPKDKQRMILYKPVWTEAEAMVFPEVFNEQYIKESAWEGVNYWQSPQTPDTMNVTPAIPGGVGGVQTVGNTFNPDKVLGVLFDEDACMVDTQLVDAMPSPVEARKRYYNLWYSFSYNSIVDLTENAIVFYMN